MTHRDKVSGLSLNRRALRIRARVQGSMDLKGDVENIMGYLSTAWNLTSRFRTLVFNAGIDICVAEVRGFMTAEDSYA